MIEQEKIVEFIASTGMYMAAVDGKVDPIELEVLKKSLANFSVFKANPEKYMYFNDIETHLKRTSSVCAYIAELDIPAKNFLLGFIIGIAISDEVLHRKEKKSLYQIAEWIGVPKKDVNESIKMLFG